MKTKYKILPSTDVDLIVTSLFNYAIDSNRGVVILNSNNKPKDLSEYFNLTYYHNETINTTNQYIVTKGLTLENSKITKELGFNNLTIFYNSQKLDEQIQWIVSNISPKTYNMSHFLKLAGQTSESFELYYNAVSFDLKIGDYIEQTYFDPYLRAKFIDKYLIIGFIKTKIQDKAKLKNIILVAKL